MQVRRQDARGAVREVVPAFERGGYLILHATGHGADRIGCAHLNRDLRPWYEKVVARAGSRVAGQVEPVDIDVRDGHTRNRCPGRRIAGLDHDLAAVVERERRTGAFEGLRHGLTPAFELRPDHHYRDDDERDIGDADAHG